MNIKDRATGMLQWLMIMMSIMLLLIAMTWTAQQQVFNDQYLQDVNNSQQDYLNKLDERMTRHEFQTEETFICQTNSSTITITPEWEEYPIHHTYIRWDDNTTQLAFNKTSLTHTYQDNETHDIKIVTTYNTPNGYQIQFLRYIYWRI